MSWLKEKIIKLYSEEELIDEMNFRRRPQVKARLIERRESFIRDIDSEEIKRLQGSQFQRVMHQIENRVEAYCYNHGETIENKIRIYDSFRHIISKELSYRCIARFAHDGRQWPSDPLSLPISYVDSDGKEILLNHEIKSISLDPKTMYLVSYPSEMAKWTRHLFRKEPLLKEYMDETMPTFYPSLNILFATGGMRHRISESYLNREPVEINATVYDDTPLYKSVVTDGINWYDSKSKRRLGQVYDFRLALIFELKRIVIGIESKV